MDEPKNWVFIAWSKERSETMAVALRDWLRYVVPACRPWCSPVDIDPGTAWGEELQGALQRAVYGVLCVTADNYESPWLNYEFGELSNKLGRSVCPLLLDTSPNDLQPTPLSRRQAKRALDRDEMLQLVASINASIDRPTPDDVVKQAFDQNWKALETKIGAIPNVAVAPPPQATREPGDKIDELLALVQGLTDSVQRSLSPTAFSPTGPRELFIHPNARVIGSPPTLNELQDQANRNYGPGVVQFFRTSAAAALDVPPGLSPKEGESK